MKKVIYYLCLVGLLMLVFNSCKEEYTLDEVDSDELHLFQDGLIFKLAETSPLTLKSLLDSVDLDLLVSDAEGKYRLSMKDTIDTIDIGEDFPVVELELEPEPIEPYTFTFEETVFPNFQMDTVFGKEPFELNVDLFEKLKIEPVKEHFAVSVTVPTVPDVAPLPFTIAPTTMGLPDGMKTIDVIMNTILPVEMKRVVKAMFVESSVVNITFDKTALNAVPNASLTHKIASFSVLCPDGYLLEKVDAMDEGSVVNGGREFVLSDVMLGSSDKSTFRFLIKTIEMPASTMNGQEFTHDVELLCDLQYEMSGELSTRDGFSEELGIDIEGALTLDDFEVETNTINIDPIVVESTIHDSIDMNHVPEIVSVERVYFEGSPKLRLTLNKIDLGDLALTNTLVDIALPTEFGYDTSKGDAGLLDGECKFTVNQDDLGRTFDFYIKSILIDKDVEEMDGNRYVPVAADYEIKPKDIVFDPQIIAARAVVDADKVFTYNLEFDEFVISSAEIESEDIIERFEPQTYDLEVSESIDPIIKKLYEVGFSEPIDVDIHFEGEGVPVGFTYGHLQDLCVTYPYFVKVESEDFEVTSATTMEIVKRRVEMANGGFSLDLSFTIVGIDFGAEGYELVDGIFEIDEQLAVDGTIALPGHNISSADVGTVVINSEVQMPPLKLRRIAAEFDLSTLDVDLNETIDLDMNDTIRDAIKNLDLLNPVLGLTIGNSTGLEVICDVKLTAIYSDSTTNELKREITIEPSPTLGVLHESVVRIENDANRDFSHFLSRIPKEIVFEAVPRAGEGEQTLDILEDNLLTVSYSLDIPLAFGDSLDIDYEAEFEGLTGILSQILALTDKFVLFLDAESTIPLDLDVELTPKDASGSDISDKLLIEIDKVLAGGSSDKPMNTQLLLDLREIEDGAIDLLDKLKVRLRATASSTIGGADLQEDQYLQVDLKVSVPEGITLDLDSQNK